MLADQWTFDNERNRLVCLWNDTVCLTIGGKSVGVDRCIAPLVQAFNLAGLPTVGSCCGHGNINASIALADGRFVEIFPDRASWEAFDALRSCNIHGEPRTVTEPAP